MANPILQYGSQGGDVAWTANILRQWGYAAAESDVYDWQTAEAVAQFQRDYGYHPDGRMGPDTWRLMEALMRGEPPPPPGGGIIDQPGAPQPGSLSAVPYNPAGTLPGGITPPKTRDASARIRQTLALWGLESLAGWASELLKADASDDEVFVELYQRPEFKARFPVIDMRHSAKLTPVTPAEVMAYERSTRELFRRAGITSDAFTSVEYIQTKLLANDVSAAELGERLEKGFMRVTQAPQEVRAAFSNYFGQEGDAALMSLFLDPDQAAPELEKKAATAFAGGIGSRFGMNLGMAIAREIADTGATESAIWQGFGAINQVAAVFEESVSEREDFTAEAEGVQATFGTRPGADRKLAERVGSRRAMFSGGGGAASDQQGVRGLGVADT